MYQDYFDCDIPCVPPDVPYVFNPGKGPDIVTEKGDEDDGKQI